MSPLFGSSFFYFLLPLLCATATHDDLRSKQSHILRQPVQITALSKGDKNYEEQGALDSCKGLLPWTCLCEPEIVDGGRRGLNELRVDSIVCAGSTSSENGLLRTLEKFPNVQSATFYGNNFTVLPERFSGFGQQKKLLYLNLTGNRIRHVHPDSLLGVPSLQSLDLSDNQIQFRLEHGDWSFLRPVRFLRRLLLRRAFKRHPGNENEQLHLLETGLRHAHLRDLQFLDISHNDFGHFPQKLVCWTPSLTHLILTHNRFRSLRFDERCTFSELKVIDLRSNRLVHFTFAFSKTANHLPPMSIQVNGNPLDCSSRTCASWHSMMWFRTTDTIRNKERVRCVSYSEDDDREKFSDFLLYAPLDETLHCSPFRTGGGSVAPRAKPSLDGKKKVVEIAVRKDEEEGSERMTASEHENSTVYANSSPAVALVYASSGFLPTGCLMILRLWF